MPVPVNVTIQHVDSETTVNDHVDADCQLLTANLALLMQAFPKLDTLSDMCQLSNHVMKMIKARRELCLKPTCIAETEDSEINITPVK